MLINTLTLVDDMSLSTVCRDRKCGTNVYNQPSGHDRPVDHATIFGHFLRRIGKDGYEKLKSIYGIKTNQLVISVNNVELFLKIFSIYILAFKFISKIHSDYFHVSKEIYYSISFI